MQQIHLSIPAPCHENWDNMQPADKGRFCNACAKQVVDFSVMSDAQVLNYFSGLKNESVCGRAYPDQLDRIMEAPAPVKKKQWYWNFVAMFLLLFAKSGDAKAQKVGKIAAVQQPVKDPQPITREVGEISVSVPKRAISGKVLNESGSPVANATIIVSGRSYTSGKDGGFVFLLNPDEKSMSINAVGFQSQSLAFSSKNNYVVKLTSTQVKGDVMITAGMMIVRPVEPKKKHK